MNLHHPNIDKSLKLAAFQGSFSVYQINYYTFLVLSKIGSPADIEY